MPIPLAAQIGISAFGGLASGFFGKQDTDVYDGRPLMTAQFEEELRRLQGIQEKQQEYITDKGRQEGVSGIGLASARQDSFANNQAAYSQTMARKNDELRGEELRVKEGRRMARNARAAGRAQGIGMLTSSALGMINQSNQDEILTTALGGLRTAAEPPSLTAGGIAEPRPAGPMTTGQPSPSEAETQRLYDLIRTMSFPQYR